MYRGKHEVSRKGRGVYKKSHMLLVSLLLIVTIGVGATVAFLMDSTEALINTFNPAEVSVEIQEEFDSVTKENVTVQNTGDIPAYVRAAIVVTWQDEAGNVYGQAPVADTDYRISLNLTDWTLVDGYYYYGQPVAAEASTTNLINSCSVNTNTTPPEGYYLCVEILAQGIQAEGMGATSAREAFAKAGGGA